jgi:hypothetical protein
MSAWQRTLNDLKQDALNKTIEDPLAEGLPVQETSELLEKLGGKLTTDGLDQIRNAAQNVYTKQPPPMCVVQGWQVALSRVRDPDTGTYHRHVSAKLWPNGRSSTAADWNNLARIVAYLGAPPNPIAVPTNPNDVHHWHWIETAD